MNDISSIQGIAGKRQPLDLTDLSKPEISIFDEKFFSDQKCDKIVIERKKITLSTLFRMGLKEAKFRNCEFQGCEFIDLYLNGSTFESCQFIGCRFNKCSFTNARFVGCVFMFTRFEQCALTLEQIRDNIPDNPSDAARMLRNLFEENRRAGWQNSAGKILIESYKQDRRHYRYIWSGHNRHYQSNYRFFQRAKYFGRWMENIFQAWFLGYGVKATPFVWMLSSFLIVYPAVLFFFNGNQETKEAPEFVDQYAAYFDAGLTISLPFASLTKNADVLQIIGGVPRYIEILGSVSGLFLFTLGVAIVGSSITKR